MYTDNMQMFSNIYVVRIQIGTIYRVIQKKLAPLTLNINKSESPQLNDKLHALSERAFNST